MMERRQVILIALVHILGFAQSTPISSEINSDDAPTCKQTLNTTFDCSQLELSVIPNNLPKSIENLNLSVNNFNHFEDNAFDECCQNLKLLDLSFNKISNLHQRHFEKLKSLEILILAHNKITSLPPDIFQNSPNLMRLDLNGNSIDLRNEFLRQPTIEELNMDSCNLEEVPDATFVNLSQLRNLTLAGNPFDKNMDTSAFKSLQNLLHLRITNLTQSATYELCENLVSIDTIYFDDVNISCTVLSDSEASFEDGIIKNEEDELEEPIILQSVRSPPSTTHKTVTVAATTTLESHSSYNANETTSAMPELKDDDLASTTNGTVTAGEVKVDIDIETVKFILAVIFVVTVFGILIGLIFRADVCNIKTKLCRTKKETENRRKPEDAMSPFEEIPLNTMNGKTDEKAEG